MCAVCVCIALHSYVCAVCAVCIACVHTYVCAVHQDQGMQAVCAVRCVRQGLPGRASRTRTRTCVCGSHYIHTRTTYYVAGCVGCVSGCVGGCVSWAAGAPGSIVVLGALGSAWHGAAARAGRREPRDCRPSAGLGAGCPRMMRFWSTTRVKALARDAMSLQSG